MRKLAMPFVLLGLVALAILPARVAATPAHFHDNFDVTFPANVCGIDVTGRAVGVDNFFPVFDANGNVVAFKDTSSVKVTFTAANGKAVTVANAGQHSGSATTNPDGSITFIDTYKGLPEKIFIPGGGQVLTRDAGIISFSNTFDANGNFISFAVLVQKGPHPEADSGFALFCQVVTSALA